MFDRLKRALARRYWTRRESGWRAEVARLETERENWQPRMDRALRNVAEAASSRVFVDVLRPPITHAPGRARNDGTRRFSLVSGDPEPLRHLGDRRFSVVSGRGKA